MFGKSRKDLCTHVSYLEGICKNIGVASLKSRDGTVKGYFCARHLDDHVRPITEEKLDEVTLVDPGNMCAVETCRSAAVAAVRIANSDGVSWYRCRKHMFVDLHVPVPGEPSYAWRKEYDGKDVSAGPPPVQRDIHRCRHSSKPCTCDRGYVCCEPLPFKRFLITGQYGVKTITGEGVQFSDGSIAYRVTDGAKFICKAENLEQFDKCGYAMEWQQ